MDISVAVLLCLALAALLFLLLWKRGASRDSGSLLMLQQQLESLKGKIDAESQQRTALLTDTVLKLQESLGLNLRNVTEGINVRLGENRNVIDGTNKRLDEAARYMLELKERLGILGEKTAALSAIGKDISRLSDVFQSPKLRGNLGELILENLLTQMLPANAFTLQHGFSDGSKVDAIIRAGGHAVPVDSKFPLERFRRLYDPETPEDQKARLKKEFFADVKKHIDSIADKYIRPDEGTFDFALMYVPSETVYYEVITQQGEENVIVDHARSRRVVPVSPNSLYAYLQVIVFGLKGMEIEKNAVEIQERLKKVQVDFGKFFEHFTKIGEGIDALRNEYGESVKRYELLDRKMGKITGEDGALLTEKPVSPAGP